MRVIWLLCIGLIAALGANPACAGVALPAWGALVRQADLIVLGIVDKVATQPDGMQLGTVRIEETYAGEVTPTPGGRRARIQIVGDPRDPDDVALVKGRRVLALLERPDGERARPSEPLHSVAGQLGVIEVDESALEPTRRWLEVLFGASNQLDLQLMEPLLRRSEPLPPRLLFAACLLELSERSADDGGRSGAARDGDLLSQMACAERGVYWADARRWAFREGGIRKQVDTRPCLETVAASAEDEATRVAATEGLGDLGDAASVPLLLTLLAEEPPSADGELDRSNAARAEAAVLALGKIGAETAVPALRDAALSSDFAVASTSIHGLGLIGGSVALRALQEVASETRVKQLRIQARETARNLRQQD